MNENTGMTTGKKVAIGLGGLIAVCIFITLVVIFVVFPFVWPCYYQQFDWYNQCHPVNPETNSPVCTDLQQLSEDGLRCEKKLICGSGYQLSADGKTCQRQNIPNPVNPVYPPKPVVCGSNQVLSNGMCIDKVDYPLGAPIDTIRDTTTDPINPNPNLPNSTSTDPIIVADEAISPPPLEPVNIQVPSILTPDIVVVPIDRKDFATKIGSMYTTLQYYIKGDRVDMVTIIPRKNPAYKGICKAVIAHSSVVSSTPSVIPVTLNAIGRTPATAPPASVDDLRSMSYYVWGDGKHMFSVIDKNSALNYRIDTTLTFPYKASS